MNDLYQFENKDKEVASSFSFDEEVLKKALKNIYSKDFHPMNDIEENMFNSVWETMNDATDKGFQKRTPDDPDYDFYQEIRKNNAVFSAFKVHRAQNDMAALLLDKNGNLKPFEQWMKEVMPIADHQMRHWLRTEYDTAVIRAHQAADWRQFEREKDILPNLKWMPSTSVHPGADHKIFWGTIRPIDDTFWNEHKPGDRWNCKCNLSSTDEKPTPVPGSGLENKPAPGLDNNPGKDAKLFGDSHPYINEAYNGATKVVNKFLRKKEEVSAYMIDGIKQIHVLDGNNRKINRVVADIEKEIRMNQDCETGMVIGKGGNILVDKRGESFSVHFSDEECGLMKDAVITHNHPRGWKNPENSLGRIGNSFSIEDLSLAVGHDAAEIRAVTPNYTFVMRRPENGWGVSLMDFREIYNKENQKLRNEFGKRIANGTLTVSQANSTHYHVLAQRVAKKYGWEYVKAKTR